MSRTSLFVFGKAAVLLIAGSVLAAAWVAPARAQTRHHISIGLGYTKLLSNDLKDSSLGIDFTNAVSGGLSYRYSITPMLDLTIDSKATVSSSSSSGVSLTLTNSYFGPGVRWYPSTASPRPFAQANVFLVDESAEAESGGFKVTSSKSGAGFGLAGGVDIKLTSLLSLPIEAHYLYGKPADDVSGIGFDVGLAWNFGGAI